MNKKEFLEKNEFICRKKTQVKNQFIDFYKMKKPYLDNFLKGVNDKGKDGEPIKYTYGVCACLMDKDTLVDYIYFILSEKLEKADEIAVKLILEMINKIFNNPELYNLTKRPIMLTLDEK